MKGDEGELPEGWVSTRLREIVKDRKGKKPPVLSEKSSSISLPYIDIEAFEKGRIRRYAPRNESVVVERGDIIVVWDGARSGLVGLAPVEGSLGSTLVHLRPMCIELQFLRWYLSSCYKDINSQTRGTGIPHVDPDVFWNLQLPVPPILEQSRIVEAVEAVLARVNAARDRLNRLPAILKRFRQSVLSAACSGRLTADWRRVNPGTEVSAEVLAATDPQKDGDWPDEAPISWRFGTTATVSGLVVDCPHSTPKWTTMGEICLRTTNFLPGRLNLSEVRYVSAGTYAERIVRLQPRPGDIVYSREGGILGIACLIPEGLRACLGQRMMMMRVHLWMDSMFVMHVLNCPVTLAVVKELTGGTASPHLNVGDVKAFRVPVPSLPEQQEIVRRVDALFALADRIEAKLAAARQRVETLTQAVLAKAFRGELVPTEAELARRKNRNYESAAELLDRIRTERERSGAADSKSAKARKPRNQK